MRFGVMGVAVAAMMAAAPAQAELFDIELSGIATGIATTYTCNQTAQLYCPVTSPYSGSFSFFDRVDLAPGLNAYSNRSGTTTYSGLIRNEGGALYGIDFRIDTVCNRSGLPYQGCTEIRASAPTFFVAGGVPEPATWAMMILGLGAAGYMMRRRKVAMQLA